MDIFDGSVEASVAAVSKTMASCDVDVPGGHLQWPPPSHPPFLPGEIYLCSHAKKKKNLNLICGFHFLNLIKFKTWAVKGSGLRFGGDAEAHCLFRRDAFGFVFGFVFKTGFLSVTTSGCPGLTL